MWFDPSALFADLPPPANSANPANYEGGNVCKLAELAKLAAHPEAANDVSLLTATKATWWLLHFPDRNPAEGWASLPATHAEILERHPEAIAAEPIHQAAPEPERTCCFTCAHRPPRHLAMDRAPCGNPVAAGLSDLPGVIRYHHHQGEGCPAWLTSLPRKLVRRILAMADRWNYSCDDVALVLDAARKDPEGWRRVVEVDEQKGPSM